MLKGRKNKMKNLKSTLYQCFFLACIALSFCACGRQEERKNVADMSQTQKDTTIKDCCADMMTTTGYSDKSVYQLNGEWIDQNGKPLKLGTFKGKKVVLAMFFASCTYACPLILNDMQKIEQRLSSDELKQTEFVFLSFDPERDTPEKLLQYAGRKNLDLKHRTLLTGNSDSILDLAAVLGFKFRKEENGSFSHTNMITLLNKAGEIDYQLIGLNQDITEFVTKIKG